MKFVPNKQSQFLMGWKKRRHAHWHISQKAASPEPGERNEQRIVVVNIA